MTIARKFHSIAPLAAVCALLVVALPVQAADPTFPMASVVGLVPPAGMVLSKDFPGFEDQDKDAAILLAVQAPAAYAELVKSLDTDALKKQGISVEKHEDMPLNFGNGTLVVGQQEADKKRYRKWLMVAPAKDVTVLVNVQIPVDNAKAYPDAVIRSALATLTVRASVPDAEKLSLLPFTVGDMQGFKIQNVLVGRAVLLADPPNDADTKSFQAHMFIAAFPGGPAAADDRAEFARVAFGEILGIENVKILMSEPLRIGNQPGFQTVAQAKDAHTGTDVMVAQWMRFGSGGFIQMIGMARADAWTDAQTRLRAVRDSIDVK
jgi:hypothetical protein